MTIPRIKSAKFIIGTTVLTLALNAVVWWVVLSLIVSGVKTLSHQCGSHYGIDKIVMGNLFCPEK